MKILRLRCECGRNIVDIGGRDERQGLAMVVKPRGGVSRDDSWRPESSPSGRDAVRTFTENWLCRCDRTHSLSRRRMLELLDEHESDPARVVILIFGRDL